MKKVLIILLTIASLITVVLGFSACDLSNPLNLHEHDWKAVYTDNGNNHYRTCKTCGEKEYSLHSYDSDNICTFCRKKFIESTNDVCSHVFGEWNNDGDTHSRVCSKCSTKQTVRHEYPDNAARELAANCSRDGYKEYVCTQCKKANKVILPKIAHSWNGGATKTAATCKAAGVKVYTCTQCGETKDEPIARIAHTLDSGMVTKEPTCKDAGVKTFTCKKCGEQTTESIPKTENHVMNKGVVEKQETCKEEGIKVYTCTICGTSTTESLPKLPFHDWGSWSVSTPATCKEDGIETATCERCGEPKTRVISKYSDHKWDSGKVTKEPTCQVEGVKTYTCEYGKETRTEPIPKLTNHSWNAGVVTKNPTCKDVGIKTFTCQIGKETRTENIEKLTTHTFGEWSAIDMETHKRSCSVCAHPDQGNHNVVNQICTDCKYKYGIVVGDLRYEFQNQTRAVGAATATVLGASTLRPTTVTIPATVNYSSVSYAVTAIAENAFRNVSSLESSSNTPSVTIPNGVKKIGAYAFANTGMTINTLPASITEVGDGAFQRCKSENLVIPATVTTWGEGVFAYSNFGTSAVTVNCPTIGVKMFANCTLIDVNIGSTVRTISREAFAGTNVIKVRIEMGITKIEKGAFSNGDVNFIFKGTKAQWEGIAKDVGFHSQNTYYLLVQGNPSMYRTENGVERVW